MRGFRRYFNPATATGRLSNRRQSCPQASIASSVCSTFPFSRCLVPAACKHQACFWSVQSIFTTSLEGWNPERLKIYERLGGPETPEKLAETEQFATMERDMFLHQKGARQPDALNP